jgi:hypothetical protein
MREPTYQSDDAKPSASRRRQPKWWKAGMSNFAKKIETENLSDLGITPIWYKEHSDVPGILNQIA